MKISTSKWCRRHANEFVMSRQDCRRWLAVRQRCVDESHSLYGLCCPGEWLWVDSNDKNGKGTFRRRLI